MGVSRKKKGKLAYPDWRKLVFLNLLVTRKESFCVKTFLLCPFKESTKVQRPSSFGRVGEKAFVIFSFIYLSLVRFKCKVK